VTATHAVPSARAAATPPRWTRADVVVLAVVMAVAAALVWPELFRGWYSWDDGAMAQVADRVLHGQLPHRDFDEPWTGGWSFVQAGIFRLFGTSLRMLRLPIFVAWLGSLACGFRLARRFVEPLAAGATTLAWAIWSLYAWHYPLLNWYYAPLALGVAWGVARFLETGQRRFVMLAGALTGLAIIQKISGLFLLAALLLWCAAHVTIVAPREPATQRTRGFAALVSLGGATFVLLVARLVLGLPREIHGSAIGLYVLPIAATVVWLAWMAYDAGVGAVGGLRALVTVMAPLVAGLAVPLVPFLLVYVAHSAMHDLLVGVFVRPAVRLALIWTAPPGRVATAGMVLAPLALALGLRYAQPGRRTRDAVIAVMLGCGVGALAQRDQFTAASAALMVRGLPLLLPLVPLWSRWRREQTARPYDSLLFLLVASATTAQLLQVPWASLPYALYATPIAVLAFVALLAWRGQTPAPAVMFGAAFLIIAGLGHPATSDLKKEPERWAFLALPRGGLWVSARDSALFDDASRIVAARPGPIHVVGDAPEYAFLFDRPTASRVIYDALADSASRDPRVVLPALERAGVGTVLLLNQFGYNDSLTVRQQRALRVAYPDVRLLGPVVQDGMRVRRFLEVRWRTAAPR
jgi:hypothetical protein